MSKKNMEYQVTGQHNISPETEDLAEKLSDVLNQFVEYENLDLTIIQVGALEEDIGNKPVTTFTAEIVISEYDSPGFQDAVEKDLKKEIN